MIGYILLNLNIQKDIAIHDKLASDENCHYVNNELSFKLLNGTVNSACFNNDGVHLNQHGTRMLVSNLEIAVKASNHYIPVDKVRDNKNRRYTRKSGQYARTRNQNTNTYTNIHSNQRDYNNRMTSKERSPNRNTNSYARGYSSRTTDRYANKKQDIRC